ncbi:MAG: BMP family ABC transporter substrate-binding protein [Bacilli bacterium]|nr:BMP family ABC transporter substrate-binding protein [Bacilli bacterium]
MKKIFSLFACLVMVVCCVLCLTACGEKKFKVGLICLHDESSTYDKNFIDSMYRALEELGLEKDQLELVTGVPEGSECYEKAVELAGTCKIVFADSFGHEDFMIQAAKEKPEVMFCHATGTKAHTEKLDNYFNAFAAIYEGRYLAGVAAGLKLKEMMTANPTILPVVGYVAAWDYAEVISGYTSWYLGVRSIVPTATMKVTYTSSWYDFNAEKAAANKLIADGCVLISQHADSYGAPEACEAAGVPNVTYNGSTEEKCPNTYVISSKIDWTPYYVKMIKAAMNGEKVTEKDYTGTIATGSVKLDNPGAKAAASGTAEKLEEVKAQLAAGTLHVFDTDKFTVGGKKVTTYMADVDSDADFTGDTEAIKDGYFHESEYRSAPYFNLIIDGIVELDKPKYQ